jgi:6,7-dimethyl-8-ribityllumazine synthase
MARAAKQPPAYDDTPLPDASDFRIGIVVASWHPAVTGRLYDGAVAALTDHGVNHDNILTLRVPGSFELIAGAKCMVENEKVDAVVCLGCIVQGETRHFEFIGQAVSQGLALLTVRFSMPFIFGVLTTDTVDQALARAGGDRGNKGGRIGFRK